MRARLGLVAVVALAATAIAASSAQGALRFLFKPTFANAGETATVRLAGTPASFTAEDAERPLRKGIRLYLVPRELGGEVGSRFDRRLHFVGRIVPDRRSRGTVSFRVPPLDTGNYGLAYWCPGCAEHSGGVVFGAQVQRSLSLRLRLPPAEQGCPVSGEGVYGNGFLSTTIPEGGVISLPRRADGTIFDKLGWLPRKGPEPARPLTVRGERLDGPGELRVVAVNWGSTNTGIGSWRSAVTFSDEGCWRITGRVGDIALTYVVRVVAA